jgi:ATP-binding cassette, subfamily B, bacterial
VCERAGTMSIHHSNADERGLQAQKLELKRFFGLTTYLGRAGKLVWSTHRGLASCYFLAMLWCGVLPGAVAYLSKLVIDAVVLVRQSPAAATVQDIQSTYQLIGAEAILVLSLLFSQRVMGYCQYLFSTLLGQKVNVLILEKALTMGLTQFEDSEFYDKLVRARREASQRPFMLVTRSVELARNIITLFGYAALLWKFSAWATVGLALAGLPAFVVEAVFSGAAFRVHNWKAPETREQAYLENLVTSETYAKEVKLFGLGPLFLQRYKNVFEKVFAPDKALFQKRSIASLLVSSLSVVALYLSYLYILKETVAGRLTLGEMSMYFLIFKQGQSAVTDSLSAVVKMYDDNLYMSNLYEFLDEPVAIDGGQSLKGPNPEDGIRFEAVHFLYPGSDKPALNGLSLHLKPGSVLALVGQNGSGKTTFVKLLAGLYRPTSGRILLDGLDLQEWDPTALKLRISIIFQDFSRYQFILGQNIGVGDATNVDDEQRWLKAAELGMASEVASELPDQYRTQLGKFFKGGRELSGGQWQKVALSRAFMRESADILVLDEPTSAVDPKAEVQLFDHVHAARSKQMVVLISHRFSTVRHADQIFVMEYGKVIESGRHEDLLKQDGHYAELFRLQAAGYK